MNALENQIVEATRKLNAAEADFHLFLSTNKITVDENGKYHRELDI